jgi:hypothetical protein
LKREKRQRHHQTRTSKQYSSQHELPVVHYSKKAHQQRTLREVSFVVVVVVIISQERRRKKKVNDRERENENLRMRPHARKTKTKKRAPVCTPAWPMWMEITSLIINNYWVF